MNKTNIADELTNFASSIQEKITKDKEEGKLTPLSIQYMKWKLDDFEYTDTGVKCGGSQGEYLTKNYWSIAATKILGFFNKTEIYPELQTNLKNIFPEYQEFYLDRFIVKFSELCIEEGMTNKQIEEFIRRFENELENGQTIKTIVELDGIVLESKSIRFNKEIELRQTIRSDLEKEVDVSSFSRNFPHTYPSAILTVESQPKHTTITVNDSDILNKIHRIIPILRLFKVGSVQFYRIRTFSDSISSQHGTSTSWSSDTTPLEKYLVNKSDEKLLTNFYHIMEKNLSDSFFRNTHDATFRDIAYRRYEDSLLTNGLIERRMANAIMGLESIFLREQEQQELAYRLRLRVARLMGFFDFNPLKVKQIVRDAYSIRSTFVHGGLLEHEKETELKEKHDNVENLLHSILDYLRISIIASIFMNASKPKLLDTIDNSFLDKEYEQQLKSLVSVTRQILGFKNN